MTTTRTRCAQCDQPARDGVDFCTEACQRRWHRYRNHTPDPYLDKPGAPE